MLPMLVQRRRDGMTTLRYWVAIPLAFGLLGCGRPTSPFCPQGLYPVAERSVAGKTLWCESKDKRRSQWIEWHRESTKLRQSCAFHDGKPQGSFTAWHPDGKSWVQGQFSDGQKIGKWKQWDTNGSEVAEGDYSAGRLVAGAPVGAMAGCENALPRR
jgi:hypothetical protein